MNRRSFFTRASALLAGIAAACSGGAIRLAEAKEPTLNEMNLGLIDVMEADKARAFEGLEHVLTETSVHPLYTELRDGREIEWTTVPPEPWFSEL